MTTAAERAQAFLTHKVRETIGKCGGVGASAVLVRDEGKEIISAARGHRKFGASGEANRVSHDDRWRLGSVSKPVTATVVGLIVQQGLGRLRWTTTLSEVFPELFSLPGLARDEYRDVTMEMLITHVAGLHYDPLAPDFGDPWFPHPPELGLNDASVVERRMKFAQKALSQKPLFTPGTGYEYGSGPIVCAAMVERRLGKRFERLMQELLYAPLGMKHSGWGTTSTADLDGVWQHGWDGTSHQHWPDSECVAPKTNFNIRGVSGNYCMSIDDMGRFLREHLRAEPKVLSRAARDDLHHDMPSPHSNMTRGSWGLSGDRNAPGSATLSFDGDDGRMYASAELHRAAGWGCAAFANVNNKVGAALVHDLKAAVAALNEHWDKLVAPAGSSYQPCVQPTLGLAAGRNGSRHLFARRHDGRLMHRKLGGSAPDEVVGGIFTSGIAAASSADGEQMIACGRGTDDRIWFTLSDDGGASWSGFQPILSGTFRTGPAVTMSGDGQDIDCFATGQDNRIWHAHSRDGGRSWVGWSAVGDGLFTSQPAAAASRTGSVLHLFGRGRDHRIWRNRSSDGGKTWQPSWTRMRGGVVTSGPSATCLITAQVVQVFARAIDRSIFVTTSRDTGETWGAWSPLAEGTLLCVPAVRTSVDGDTLEAVSLGGDFRTWRCNSTDGGASWNGWSQTGAQFYL